MWWCCLHILDSSVQNPWVDRSRPGSITFPSGTPLEWDFYPLPVLRSRAPPPRSLYLPPLPSPPLPSSLCLFVPRCSVRDRPAPTRYVHTERLSPSRLEPVLVWFVLFLLPVGWWDSFVRSLLGRCRALMLQMFSEKRETRRCFQLSSFWTADVSRVACTLSPPHFCSPFILGTLVCSLIILLFFHNFGGKLILKNKSTLLTLTQKHTTAVRTSVC